jgi:hypothetical protein
MNVVMDLILLIQGRWVQAGSNRAALRLLISIFFLIGVRFPVID